MISGITKIRVLFDPCSYSLDCDIYVLLFIKYINLLYFIKSDSQYCIAIHFL